jgi:hypothetical protein
MTATNENRSLTGPSTGCLQVNRKNYMLIWQSITIFENDSKRQDYIPKESKKRLSSGIASYHSVQSLLYSHLLSNT